MRGFSNAHISVYDSTLYNLTNTLVPLCNASEHLDNRIKIFLVVTHRLESDLLISLMCVIVRRSDLMTKGHRRVTLHDDFSQRDKRQLCSVTFFIFAYMKNKVNVLSSICISNWLTTSQKIQKLKLFYKEQNKIYSQMFQTFCVTLQHEAGKSVNNQSKPTTNIRKTRVTTPQCDKCTTKCQRTKKKIQSEGKKRVSRGMDKEESYLLPRRINRGKSTDLTMLVVRLVKTVAVSAAQVWVSHVYVRRQMRSGERRSAALRRAKYWIAPGAGRPYGHQARSLRCSVQSYNKNQMNVKSGLLAK